MKPIYLALAFCLVVFNTYSQATLNSVHAFGYSSSPDASAKVIEIDENSNVFFAGSFSGVSDVDPSATTILVTAYGGYDILFGQYDSLGSLIWTNEIGGLGEDKVGGMAMDASKSLYLAGTFGSTADFDPSPIAEYNLTSSGGQDAFIAKYDSLGRIIWAKQIGGLGDDEIYSIAISRSGIINVTGSFNQTADFDPSEGIVSMTSLTSGVRDIFFAAFEANGTFKFVKQLQSQSSSSNTPVDMAVDKDGNLYMTAGYTGTVDFDPGAGTMNAGAGFISNIFLSKYDSLGNFVWAKFIGSSQVDVSSDVVTDSLGSIYISGYFMLTVDFDPGPGTFNLVQSTSGYASFLAKYNPAGELVWAKKTGSNDSELNSVCVDNLLNVYTTGYYNGTSDFDPGPSTLNGTSVNNSKDIYFAKYNSLGGLIWVKKIGQGADDVGYNIKVNKRGRIAVGGEVEQYLGGQPLDVDPGAGTVNVVPKYVTLFCASFDTSGNYLWARINKNYTCSYDAGNKISEDNQNNILVCGAYRGVMDADPSPINGYYLQDGQIFLAKYDINGALIWAGGTVGGNSTSVNGMKVDTAGNIYLAGEFSGAVDFNIDSIATYYLTSSGSYDIFVCKYGPNGNFIWAKKYGFIAEERLNDLEIDSQGNIYIAGYFNGDAKFDPSSGSILSSGGLNANYVAKYNSSGSFLWQRTPPSSGNSSANDLCVTGNSVYVCGNYAGQLNTVSSQGLNDAYLMKLDINSGATVWFRGIGGASDDFGEVVCLNSDNKVMISGSFTSTIDLDAGVGVSNLTSNGSSDIFMTLYDQSGIYEAGFNIGGTGTDKINAIKIDAGGNYNITGYFQNTVDFDTELPVFNLTSNGAKDIFVLKLNSNMRFSSAWSVGGPGDDEGRDLLANDAQNLKITGCFFYSPDFDPSTSVVTPSVSTNNTFGDVFIANYTPLCVESDFPVSGFADTIVCENQSLDLFINPGASLNSATAWTWREDSITGQIIALDDSVTIFPSSARWYYIISTGGCGGNIQYDSVLVAWYPNPTVSANIHDTSFCFGSSIVLSGNGANTYSWSNGAIDGVSFVPSLSLNYIVTGADINGCVGTDSIYIAVDSCDLVYPGDANYDGIANNNDLLEIGLGFGTNGTSRTIVNSSWQGYLSAMWANDTVSTGYNLKHADCNGDGVINNDDTLAINLNYGLTHTLRPSALDHVNTTGDIYFGSAQTIYGSNQSVAIDVYLGESTNPLTNFYGAAFTIDYDDNTLIQPSSMTFNIDNTSWVGTINTDAIRLTKTMEVSETIDAAICKTDHVNTSGFGKIGTLRFATANNTGSFSVSASNAYAIDNTGTQTPLTTATYSVAIDPSVSLHNFVNTSSITIYPNPNRGNFTVGNLNSKEDYLLEVKDMLGRTTYSQEVKETGKINIKLDEAPGVYWIQLNSKQGSSMHKIIIE